MKSLAPNTLLQNRYLVVHLIGKGGMGDVYLAVDQRLGSAVALKRTFFADDVLLGNAFEREAKTLARLRHPVLPKVSDHFSEGGEQYLVMEHISGEDLSKRLEAAQKPFPLSWVLFWADQMLDALAYLHTHEPPIIHRDIKPQNLKLTDENHIILLDFGLSKNSSGETKAVTTGGSATGSIVGYTPHYAPMEQIRGTGTNPRSDLYSLSATLYQLLTNIIPADALSRADTLLNGSPDPIKPIYELNPEVSKQVSDVILKGMEVSQERRFSAAREMQKILRDAYAQMQNMMAAQTMAFNLQEVEEAAPPVNNSGGQQTGRLETSPENGSAAANIQPPNLSGAYLAEQPSSGGNSPPIQSSDPNFDQTLRMDTPPALRQENAAPVEMPKQSDVKTEVFLTGQIAAATPPPVSLFAAENKAENKPGVSEPNFNPTENFALTGDYNLHRNADQEENFVAGSTVPLFTTGESNSQPADSGFYPGQQAANGEAAEGYEDFSATSNFSGAEIAGSQTREFVVEPQSIPKAAPVKKKSGGKILGVIVGLGALLLLAGGAIGGGWWYYAENKADDSPASTATPMPTAASTLAPTPEDTPDTNVNAAGANNSNIGGTTEANTANDDANVGIKPTPNEESTPKAVPTVRTHIDKPGGVSNPPKTPKTPKTPKPPIPAQ